MYSITRDLCFHDIIHSWRYRPKLFVTFLTTFEIQIIQKNYKIIINLYIYKEP